MLEAEEHAAGGPAVGAEVGDVLAAEADPAGGDLVAGVGEEGLGQGGLARAVGSHQRVELALADGQRDAAQDLGLLHGHVEVVELERGAGAMAPV